MAKYSDVFNFLFTSGRDLKSDSPDVQGLIDKGAITNDNQKWNDFWALGHPGEAPVTYVDPEQLPKTSFGTSIVDVRQPGAGGFKTINPKLVTDDPNYGLISPLFNELDPSLQKNGYDMIGPAFAAILGMAVGIPAFATLALSGVKAVGGLDAGNSSNLEEMYKAGVSSLKEQGSGVAGDADPYYVSESGADNDLFKALSSSVQKQTTLYNLLSVDNQGS